MLYEGSVLDDVRDLEFLVFHQEKLKGKYDCEVEFGSTPSGNFAFSLDLYGIPIVVTINGTTRNQSLLETDDFLGNPENRVVVDFPLPAATDEDALQQA